MKTPNFRRPDKRFPTRQLRVQKPVPFSTTCLLENEQDVWTRTTEKFSSEFSHSLDPLRSLARSGKQILRLSTPVNMPIKGEGMLKGWKHEG